MILLPDKNRKLSRSIVGMGAQVLRSLKSPQTVSSSWEKSRDMKSILTFEDFVLAVDFLFTINLVQMDEGILKKVR